MNEYADNPEAITKDLSRIAMELGAKSVLVIVATEEHYAYLVRGNRKKMQGIVEKHVADLRELLSTKT